MGQGACIPERREKDCKLMERVKETVFQERGKEMLLNDTQFTRAWKWRSLGCDPPPPAVPFAKSEQVPGKKGKSSFPWAKGRVPQRGQLTSLR